MSFFGIFTRAFIHCYTNWDYKDYMLTLLITLDLYRHAINIIKKLMLMKLASQMVNVDVRDFTGIYAYVIHSLESMVINRSIYVFDIFHWSVYSNLGSISLNVVKPLLIFAFIRVNR